MNPENQPFKRFRDTLINIVSFLEAIAGVIINMLWFPPLLLPAHIQDVGPPEDLVCVV